MQQCSNAHTHSPQTTDPGPTSGRRPGDYPIERAGLTERQIGQLKTYMEYMLDVNKSMNLTGAAHGTLFAAYLCPS